ncbi:unnamed protein product [Rotaria socialis]|uniref:Uncharacterized protein n=1 Tax=Rotaria socialis TaxID=392032 RepID=A0A821YZW7_9BILA|nr:unnamed protein product [Rotaria socialis]CAF4973449.1 unnamed protein product [Rotaria socialis]
MKLEKQIESYFLTNFVFHTLCILIPVIDEERIFNECDFKNSCNADDDNDEFNLKRHRGRPEDELIKFDYYGLI